MKVFGYVRCSTIKQKELGDTIATQKENIKKYCDYKKLDLVQIYSDGGISGGIAPMERQGLSELMKRLEKGDVDGIVCCKIDRISRNSRDFSLLMGYFKDNKINFYCINPDIDTTTPIGQMIIGFMSHLAELEKSMISTRTKDVMENKKNNNECVGSIPFGKKIKENNNSNKKILEDDPEEQETIKIAKQLYEKNMKLKDICEELKKQKRKNKKGGNNFYPEQIKRMLKIENTTRIKKVKRIKLEDAGLLQKKNKNNKN
jgi:DNA invertase Pin-like site-specific DNA recombinase